MGRVVVVGSANVDFVVAGARLPRPGETVIGGTFEQFHGGKGANQAVAAARLGADVAFVGAIGEDDLGADALRALEAEGVGVESVTRIGGVATGVALILVAADGENMISVASGANERLSAEYVRQALDSVGLRDGDVVLVSCEIPLAAVDAALRIGRQRGATTVLNPAPADGLTLAMLASADLVTPNEHERAVLPTGGSVATLTSHGPDGAGLEWPGLDAVSISAPGVTAVDATGAGDALNGAFAAGLADGLDIETAARRAIAAASLSVTRPGARGGTPTRPELEAFLRPERGGSVG